MSKLSALRFAVGSIRGLAPRTGRKLAQFTAAVAITKVAIASVFVANIGVIVVTRVLVVGTGRVGTHLAIAAARGLRTGLLFDSAFSIGAVCKQIASTAVGRSSASTRGLGTIALPIG